MAIDITEQAGASTSAGILSGSHAVPVIPHFSRSLPSRPSGPLPAAGALFKKRRVLRHSSNSDENRWIPKVDMLKLKTKTNILMLKLKYLPIFVICFKD